MSSLEAGVIVSRVCRTQREFYEFENMEDSFHQKECLAMHGAF